MSEQRLALVHEWFHERTGSERTFEEIAKLFPAADLYALSREPAITLDLDDRELQTTFIDRPLFREHMGLALPAMPFAWRAMGRGRYDAVVTSHHAFAQSNRLGVVGAPHLVYVHAPARYVWTPEIDSRGAGWHMSAARAVLRGVDRRATRRVSSYAANSQEVAGRIRQFWDRDAEVINPPVRVDYFAVDDGPAPTRDYVLGVGRWIPYKQLHLVVEAGARAGLPVKIAGQGTEKARILAAAEAAGVPVEIVESPTDAQLRTLYRNAAVLVFPTVEDFGIVPVEAQAAGTPVVAIGRGGARETVVDGESGVLTETVEVADLARAIQAAVGLDAEACRRNARRFSEERFRAAILDWTARSGISSS